MYWHDYSKEKPPMAGRYEILMLTTIDYDEKGWYQTTGIYNANNKLWSIWLDGFGWSSDAGTPSYWLRMPPEPPIPYEGPICEYFHSGDYCSAQKDMPRCYCQGNKEKCEK